MGCLVEDFKCLIRHAASYKNKKIPPHLSFTKVLRNDILFTNFNDGGNGNIFHVGGNEDHGDACGGSNRNSRDILCGGGDDDASDSGRKDDPRSGGGACDEDGGGGDGDQDDNRDGRDDMPIP
uniref:Uncharacterized protein n=2 Tax=Araneus ventricosus TaxID=182803 RepID=A0A4Y2G134_ARAVE|nr:hypothetical protein AVEN_229000-1 [Araneus ventricosus]